MMSQFATVVFAVCFGFVFAFQANAQTTIRRNEAAKGDSLGESVTKPTQTITRSSTNGQTNTTITESISGSGLNTQTATSVTVTPVPQNNSFNWLPMVLTVGLPLAAPLMMGAFSKDKKDDEKNSSEDASSSEEVDASPAAAEESSDQTTVARNRDQQAIEDSKRESDVENKKGGEVSAQKDQPLGTAVTKGDEAKTESETVGRSPGGEIRKCGALPTRVKAALKEAKAFRDSCSLTAGKTKRIAINDYAPDAVTPTMFIFDNEGNCLFSTAISYGNGFSSQAGTGVGTLEKPRACAEGTENATPPGFHVTAPHEPGGIFPADKSLRLNALEGQGSYNRAILIHVAKQPGYGTSLGCTGVGEESIGRVMSELGTGSLVYNYFGNATKPAGCNTDVGFGAHNGASCTADKGAAKTRLSSGDGSGSGMDNN